MKVGIFERLFFIIQKFAELEIGKTDIRSITHSQLPGINIWLKTYFHSVAMCRPSHCERTDGYLKEEVTCFRPALN